VTLEAEEVRILRLEPGDEIVLRTTRRITREQANDIRKFAEERWPDHKITVLGDMEMEVVRADH
jgi:hypothetical protein